MTAPSLVFTHPACLEHFAGSGHPERPERLRTILEALGTSDFEALQWREAPVADDAQLRQAHDVGHIVQVLNAIPDEGLVMLDADTLVSPGSKEAARRAAGAAIAAVDAVLANEARTAFCAVRPPGHHAEPERAMGFCLFNNVIVGARHALEAHGLERVAVIDFDVHHGNGSETAAMRDSRLLYCSTHQVPLYPGTGLQNSPEHPNVVNVPLRPGAGSAEFRAALHDAILPALRRFEPELLMISAGFDAHLRDPLAELCLVEDDFAWATMELAHAAGEPARGRVVSTLEGGYDLQALAASAAAHVRALLALGREG